MRALLDTDDIQMSLVWQGETVQTSIKDTSEVPAERKEDQRDVTPEQAGAIAALFVAGDMPDSANTALYAIAELALADMPQNLRPIP